MNLFDLFAYLGLDDSEFVEKINSAGDLMKNVASGIGKAASTIGKVTAAGFTAAATATAALAKQSVEAYANYEQLVGGVDTLFSNLEGTVSAAPKVLENASRAFETAGMSANQYMSTVTSFSAALITSLNNDYDKAAEVSDMAIQDMADNANKLGTDIKSIENAYKGFAKANYTMLDNLSLGYGGTRSEMERLLADAEKFSGIHYDISNLSDVYEAIHVIQEQFGIAGATAEEASTTIDGSLKALSASWENLVTGFADKNADLGKLIDDVVQSAETAFGNLLPVIETALGSIAEGIEKIAPMIAEKIPELIDDVLPPLLSAASSLISSVIDALPSLLDSLGDALPEALDSVIETLSDVLPKVLDEAQKIIEGVEEALPEYLDKLMDILPTAIVDMVARIGDMLPDLVNMGVDIIVSLADGMSDTLPELMPVAVDAILKVVDTLIDNIDKVVDAAIEIVIALADGFANSVPKLIEKVPGMMIKLATALVENIDKLAEVPGKIIKAIADGLVHTDWEATANAMMDNLIAALDVAQKKVQLWMDDVRAAFGGERLYNGDIANVGSTDFVKNMQAGKDVVVSAIGDFTRTVEESYDSFYGAEAKAAEESVKQGKSNFARLAEKFNKQKEEAMKKIAEQNNKTTSIVTNSVKSSARTILDEEEKVNNTAQAERKAQATKRQADAESLAKKAAEQQRKALEKHFSQLEVEQLANGYTEEWLVQQERMYVNALDHSTDLYEEYNLKVMKAEKQISDAVAKTRKENAENTKKSFASMVDDMIKSAKDKISEYTKAVEDIKSKISDFAQSLTKAYKDMFKFETDEETGKVTATKTRDFITNATKQLEDYLENINKLREKGISESMLNQLTTMSSEEGAAVAEYWQSLSEGQLNTLNAKWQKYEKTGQQVSEALYTDELQEAEKQLDGERNTLLTQIKESVDKNLESLLKAISDLGETTININGIQYQNIDDLTSAISKELGFNTSRKGAGYAV